MSSELRGLRTVIYPTTDLAASQSWWSDYLGFAPYFDEPFYVGFEVAGYELGLVPTEESGAGPTTYWGVDDVAHAVADAEANGAVLLEAPQDVGDGIIVASFENPSGHVVGLIYNPHFTAK
jgi:catechol 2,3-dioxygenase-like lactoylglutathione lyase family enzyme